MRGERWPRSRSAQATAADAGTIVRMIRALAEYERLLDRVRIEEADVLRDGFGPRPCFECLLAEIAGETVGFALYHDRLLDLRGPPRDLRRGPVRHRGRARAGASAGMLLARLASARARARLARASASSVLDWNPARAFYDRLGFAEASGWLPYRMTGAALEGLAAEDR